MWHLWAPVLACELRKPPVLPTITAWRGVPGSAWVGGALTGPPAAPSASIPGGHLCRHGAPAMRQAPGSQPRALCRVERWQEAAAAGRQNHAGLGERPRGLGRQQRRVPAPAPQGRPFPCPLARAKEVNRSGLCCQCGWSVPREGLQWPGGWRGPVLGGCRGCGRSPGCACSAYPGETVVPEPRGAESGPSVCALVSSEAPQLGGKCLRG